MSNPGVAQRLPLPGRALALVVAGGRAAGGSGTSQPPLALQPTPPAHFGGKFRTVDFALSNCLNSGIRRIAVLTPSSSHSLQRHLARSWSFLKGDDSEFLKFMPAPLRVRSETAAGSTRGAHAQLRELVAASGAEFVLVLSGDRIYKMNCAALLADHVAKGRACTVACIDAPPVPPPGSPSGPTTVTVDANGHITGCAAEQGPSAPSVADHPMQSLGVHVFNTRHLLAELDRHNGAATHSDAYFGDFIHSSVLRAVHSAQASAHHFADSCVGGAAGAAPYWRDLANLDAYWHAHIDLTARAPQLDLYDPNWPIRAQQAELAPAKFLHNEAERRGMAVESLVSGGSIISGSVLRSVLFSSVRVHSYAQLEWSVLLPAVQVGRHARLKRVVVDSACTIPEGLVVGEDAVADAARFFRSSQGITFVTAEMLSRLPGAPQPATHRGHPCATS